MLIPYLCYSWHAMDPGWVKTYLDKWISHFGDWKRRGFQNIVWFVCWMGWNPLKLSVLLNLGNYGPESFSQEISVVYTHVASYSRGVIAFQRTPSHSRGPHRTPYTCSQIIVLHKGDRISEITILEEKMNLKIFFWFPPSEEKFFGI